MAQQRRLQWWSLKPSTDGFQRRRGISLSQFPSGLIIILMSLLWTCRNTSSYHTRSNQANGVPSSALPIIPTYFIGGQATTNDLLATHKSSVKAKRPVELDDERTSKQDEEMRSVNQPPPLSSFSFPRPLHIAQ